MESASLGPPPPGQGLGVRRVGRVGWVSRIKRVRGDTSWRVGGVGRVDGVRGEKGWKGR